MNSIDGCRTSTNLGLVHTVRANRPWARCLLIGLLCVIVDPCSQGVVLAVTGLISPDQVRVCVPSKITLWRLEQPLFHDADSIAQLSKFGSKSPTPFPQHFRIQIDDQFDIRNSIAYKNCTTRKVVVHLLDARSDCRSFLDEVAGYWCCCGLLPKRQTAVAI